MISFNNNNNEANIKISYETGLNTKSKTYYIRFSVEEISPLFNGEFFYVSEDDIGETSLMFRFNEDDEWKDIDIYKSYPTVEEVYSYMGFFIDIVNLTNERYNSL
jgi:hypothetical protein